MEKNFSFVDTTFAMATRAWGRAIGDRAHDVCRSPGTSTRPDLSGDRNSVRLFISRSVRELREDTLGALSRVAKLRRRRRFRFDRRQGQLTSAPIRRAL